MYQIGDWIIYGDMGACHVTEIKTIDSSWLGDSQLYYVLKPLSQNCMISAPVDSTKVFTRPVISKREAERLVDGIPSIEAQAYYSERVHELAQHYKTYIVRHDCGDLIELTMSLHAKKRHTGEEKGRFGAVDQKFMNQAEDLLFGELSVALGIPREAVAGYIASRVDGQALGKEHQ
jgi:CarD family transcriptional regulator